MTTIRNLSTPPAGPYTAQLWHEVADIADSVFNHPFCLGMADGTLPERCFKHYLGQDLLYIEQDARAFAIIAGKSDNNREFSFFLEMAKDGIEIERKLHKELLPLFQVSRPGKMSEVCRDYTSYLINSALNDDYPAAAAALLPCFWVYRETGIKIRERATKNNPYQKWLDTYSDELYGNYVKQYVEIVEELMTKAPKNLKERMIEAFRNSTAYENKFFSEAWNIKQNK